MITAQQTDLVASGPARRPFSLWLYLLVIFGLSWPPQIAYALWGNDPSSGYLLSSISMIMVGGLMFTSFAGPLWGVEGIPPMLQLTDWREAREVFTGAAVTAVIFGALAVWGMMR